MNAELQNLLHRWREGSLTTEEMRTLTAELAQPEAREALRRDWFLEAALPQALAASAVILRTPRPALAERLHGWTARHLTILTSSDSPDERTALFALRLWARASFAALAVGLITASWLLWPLQEEINADPAGDFEPAYLAKLMIQTQLAD